jgi:Zn-dependent peptidase ImmA (M78 family)
VDIIGIATFLGLGVWESSELGNGIAGKIFRDTENGGTANFSIVVKADDSVTRKRFTVAHELAHYLLHRNLFRKELVDDALYRSSLSNPIEAQANYLAAELLMPSHLLRPLSEAGKGATELASLFGVSEQAMNIRLSLIPQAAIPVES